MFGRIKDNTPLLSEKTFFRIGPSAFDDYANESTYESFAILNPFLLIEPLFVDFTVWGKKAELSGIQHPSLFQPKISNLEYFPADRKIITTIEMTTFLNELSLPKNDYLEPIIPYPLALQLNGYNARDLGLNLIRFIGQGSNNVTSPFGDDFEMQIIEHLRVNKLLCNNQVGCNHRSEGLPELKSFQIHNLPATAIFILSRLNDNSKDNTVEFRLQIK